MSTVRFELRRGTSFYPCAWQVITVRSQGTTAGYQGFYLSQGQFYDPADSFLVNSPWAMNTKRPSVIGKLAVVFVPFALSGSTLLIKFRSFHLQTTQFINEIYHLYSFVLQFARHSLLYCSARGSSVKRDIREAFKFGNRFSGRRRRRTSSHTTYL